MKHCTIETCKVSRIKLWRGMCQKHYESWKRYKDPLETERRAKVLAEKRALGCKVLGCKSNGLLNKSNKRYYPNGYCGKHYARIWRKGTIEVERTPKTSEYHGKSRTPRYNNWANMIQRCHNPKNSNYKHYGARGIKVCDKWRNSYESFLEDMGERPEGMTLDRIDNDSDYEPSNCRWASATTQNRNKRYNKFLEIKGERKTISEWATYSDVSHSQITRRVKDGWDSEKAVFGERIRARKSVQSTT